MTQPLARIHGVGAWMRLAGLPVAILALAACASLPDVAGLTGPVRWGVVGFRLVGDERRVDLQLAAGDESYVSKRAQFARNNLWVTAYDRTERFAAGEFPNQATG